MSKFKEMRSFVKPGAIFVFVAVIVYSGFMYSTYSDLNSLANPLNDAERPEEAFDTLITQADPETAEKLGEKVEGEKLHDRIELARLGFKDYGIQGREVFSVLVENTTEAEKIGKYYTRCGEESSKCGDSINYPIFSSLAVSYQRQGIEGSTLQHVWKNETLAEKYSMYLERAEYYDSRLRDNEFSYRPLETAFYNEHGLYMTGSHDGSIKVDGESLSPERNGKMMYLDTNLTPGSHEVTAGNQSIDLKVFYPVPEMSETASNRLAIERTTKYDTAVLNGSKGVKTVELNEDNLTVASPPETTYRDSRSFSNPEKLRQFSVKLISDEVNKTVMYGNQPEKKDKIDIEDLYIYGMNREEYRDAQELIKRSEALPLFRTPQEKAKSF